MKNLPTLQELFNHNIFKVPDYQRGYSWENRHREDLLEDLDLIRDKKNHYTGTIVIKEKGKREGLAKTFTIYDVVDGQQRFTSLIILLNSIANEMEDLKYETSLEIADIIKQTYIKEKSRDGPSIYKLELDDDNNSYFRDAIIENKKGVEKTIESHKRLANAKKQFTSYLVSKRFGNFPPLTEEEYFQLLNRLLDKISQSLVFTLYEVEDDAEVGVIFEVMNDRGKPLSELEKVKNYLIYLTGRISEGLDADDLVKRINESWKVILENLSLAGMSKNSDENRFLRLNYIINYYSKMRTIVKDGKKISINSQLADIHKQLKDYFKKYERNEEYDKCYSEMEEYIDSLKSMSARLRDILNPDVPQAFPNIEDEKIKRNLLVTFSQIGRLEVQSNILVLAVSLYEKFIDQPQRLLKLMQLSEILAFRIYYLWGYMASKLQTRLYKLSCDIYQGKKNYSQIYSEINNILEHEAPEFEIESKLTSNDDFYEWKGLRYFLYEYERFKCRKEINEEPELTWDHLKNKMKKETIEHILPQTIVGSSGEIKYWTERFTTSEHIKNVRRLGNLTLSTTHIGASNKGFDNKKEYYKTSKWFIERDLIKYREWKIDEIDHREKELIAFAMNRWSTHNI
ncbi:DUF262 domain-containing HNH endonuclease family protein [Methanobacterium sp. BAmetb5]|uniref:DUF262 domain-containing protein n=1 Tax=Methanobacterium sp. BAmetb5 TaxID=2025351 RepID=UPI0025CF0EEC|nr:DUF262 domain-containing HNH endonuclease family protein [Methanobacterium sp. BAmetb5]